MTSRVVRPGHHATLDYMASPEFREVKALFESYPEIGGVYFRPTDKGVTVVDLNATSPKPRIGVGDDPYIARGTTAAQLAPTMPGRIGYLREVRARQRRPSLENQFEAMLIREAQGNHLRLPGFPERLRFIHSQWRIDTPQGGSHQFTDLLAVDLATCRLVLIELKASPDSSAHGQVQQYLAYFRAHSHELNPFFARVGQVMGSLYGCAELVALDQVDDPQVTLVAWPGTRGIPVVIGAEQGSTPPHSGDAADNGQVVSCPNCRQANRLRSRPSPDEVPRCGRCHAPLLTAQGSAGPSGGEEKKCCNCTYYKNSSGYCNIHKRKMNRDPKTCMGKKVDEALWLGCVPVTLGVLYVLYRLIWNFLDTLGR